MSEIEIVPRGPFSLDAARDFAGGFPAGIGGGGVGTESITLSFPVEGVDASVAAELWQDSSRREFEEHVWEPLDANVSKSFQLRGGKNRLKLTFDGFNLTNISTVTSYRTSNTSASVNSFGVPQYLQVSGIVPPRVFRFGANFNF